MNFSFIDENVSGSASPFSKREVEWMIEKMKIGAILSVREIPLSKSWLTGIDYRNVPVRNHYSPTLDQLKECVNFIMSETTTGKKTTVHCAAGQGRTGTVLAAYLCLKYGMTADEAIKKVRSQRRGSVESNQKAVVQEYYNDLIKSQKTQ